MADVKRASFAAEDMKEGSNLFDNVRATLIGGRFTKEAPDNYTVEGNPIFGVIDLLLAGDGPEEERRVNQSYSLGAQSGDHFTLNENGDYLIPNDGDEDARIRKDCKFATLALSMGNEGVPKTIMADFAFSKVTGMDAQWKRIADKERSFADDKRKAGKSKFPPSTLCVVKLYALPGEKAADKPNGKATNVATAPAATTKAAPTAAATTTAPVTTAAGPVDDADVWPYLETVLKAKGGTEQRGRLTLAVSRAAMDNVNRQTIAKRASDEAFINEMVEAGFVTYAPSEKGQPVSIAA